MSIFLLKGKLSTIPISPLLKKHTLGKQIPAIMAKDQYQYNPHKSITQKDNNKFLILLPSVVDTPLAAIPLEAILLVVILLAVILLAVIMQDQAMQKELPMLEDQILLEDQAILEQETMEPLARQ